jgi:hypothetical protein
MSGRNGKAREAATPTALSPLQCRCRARVARTRKQCHCFRVHRRTIFGRWRAMAIVLACKEAPACVCTRPAMTVGGLNFATNGLNQVDAPTAALVIRRARGQCKTSHGEFSCQLTGGDDHGHGHNLWQRTLHLLTRACLPAVMALRVA